ncbi:Uncharacterised protein [Bordetella pertussis]|nr:Uncharacterised protein [Bordetella pertussis]
MCPRMIFSFGKRSNTPPNSSRSACVPVSTPQPQVAPASSGWPL